MPNKFFKENENDIIWWVNDGDKVGTFLFSFDRKKIYRLFYDYPDALTKEEKEIFDNENPFWAKYLQKKGGEYLHG